MLKRPNGRSQVSSSKRRRISEYSSALIPLSIEAHVEFAKSMSQKKIDADEADITYHLLQIYAYLFDSENFEKSKQWVKAKLASNKIHEVIFFIGNIGRLLNNENSVNLVPIKDKQNVTFLKWMLQNIAECLGSETRGGLRTLSIAVVQNILYNLSVFVEKNFISKDTVEEIHDNILELLQRALDDVDKTDPKTISNMLCNLKELERSQSLKNPISIQTINVLLKAFVNKKDEATSKDISNIVFTLGECAKRNYFISEAGMEMQINIDDINSLLKTLIMRKSQLGQTVKARDIGSVIYGLANLAQSKFLSGSVDIEYANSFLEILCTLGDAVDIIDIINTVYGLGRLSKEKRLESRSVPAVRLKTDYINYLLELLVKKAYELKPSDISSVLYWLGELAINEQLEGRIKIEPINSLLKRLFKQKAPVKLKDIRDTINGLVKLAQKGYLKGQIETSVIDFLSEIVEKDGKHIVSFRVNINELKIAGVLQDNVENITSISLQPTIAPVASQRSQSSLRHEQDLFSLSVSDADKDKDMYDPFADKDMHVPFSDKDMHVPFANKDMYDPFAEEEDSLVEFQEEQAGTEIDVINAQTKEETNEKSEVEEDMQIDEESEMGFVDEARLTTEVQTTEHCDEEETEIPGNNEDEIAFVGAVRNIPQEYSDGEEMTEEESESEIEEAAQIGEETTAVVEQPAEATAVVEQPAEATAVVEQPAEATAVMEQPAEATAVVEQPAEAGMLGAILKFIRERDIDGLNGYLNLPRHHCNERALSVNIQKIYYGSHEQTATAAPPENRYYEAIKEFFDKHCNAELVKRTPHGYFISLLKAGAKAGSRIQFYDLCRENKLTPLILHLPDEELHSFIAECINPLRLQQDPKSLLAVIDALCQRYEAKWSDERFRIEKLIKSLIKTALNSHKLHRFVFPVIDTNVKNSTMSRLKQACLETIENELRRLQSNANTVGERSQEPRDELEAISTLLCDLIKPMKELIDNNLDVNKQAQLGEGTHFYNINITWVLTMACVYLQLEKQVADYLRNNGHRNVGITAQCAFFATNAATRALEMQAINDTLSRLGRYVQIYRRNCEEITEHGITSIDRLGGCISQCYRDYENTVARIELQRVNPGLNMRASA